MTRENECVLSLSMEDAAAAHSETPNAVPRPLEYWLEHHPPGWISRHTAQDADPIALASDAYRLGTAFLRWLQLTPSARWDTFGLQTLSAALFNRYRAASGRGHAQGNATDVELWQLNWPAGSSAVQVSIAKLRELLGPPFAVYKAVRAAIPREAFPMEHEMQLAERTLESLYPELQLQVARLGEALQSYMATKKPPNMIERKTISKRERLAALHSAVTRRVRNLRPVGTASSFNRGHQRHD